MLTPTIAILDFSSRVGAHVTIAFIGDVQWDIHLRLLGQKRVIAWCLP